MSATAVHVYNTIRTQGTQESLLSQMQTREELYEVLNYYQYENQLDAKGKGLAMTKKMGGLEGIIVGETAISTVGKEGIGLTYRGYDIHDLAAYSTFEEVAYLLIYDELPTQAQLQSYREKLIKMRRLPNELKLILETIPGSAHPMDVLRTSISMLGTLETETAQYTIHQIADRLIACTPSILLYWYQFHRNNIRIETWNSEEKTIAGYFLHLLHGKKPDEDQRRALDVS